MNDNDTVLLNDFLKEKGELVKDIHVASATSTFGYFMVCVTFV